MFTDATDPALVTALSTPASFGDGGDPVETLQTHVSHLFLVGNRAFKLKKAVGFPFCDFSTLAARQRAAALEISLNRRTAPDMYLGLQPVSLAPDGTAVLGPLIADPGEATLPEQELLVVMRRFDRSRQLDQLFATQPMDRATALGMAEQVAALHRDAEVVANDQGHAKVRTTITDLITNMGGVSPPLPQDKVAAFRDLALAQVDALASTLNARAAGDKVRRCHGDLHLGNIYAGDDGQPVLFDAIEFNDSFAEIDVLYDLAFLLMDLIHRGMTAQANQVLNRYLEQSQDYGGLGLLAPFIATRAAIRAMVTGFGTSDDPVGRQAAHAYLDTALAVLAPPTPRVIAMGGLSASGKSTLARALAPDIGPPPGAVVLRSDKIRKTLHGVQDEEKLPQAAYTRAETERTYAQMSALAETVALAGLPVILDGRHATEAQIAHAERAATAAGVVVEGLWLTAPVDELRQRIDARTGDVSDADRQVLEDSLKLPQIDPVATHAWHEIDTAGATPSDISGPLAAARLALLGGEG